MSSLLPNNAPVWTQRLSDHLNVAGFPVLGRQIADSYANRYDVLDTLHNWQSYLEGMRDAAEQWAPQNVGALDAAWDVLDSVIASREEARRAG